MDEHDPAAPRGRDDTFFAHDDTQDGVLPVADAPPRRATGHRAERRRRRGSGCLPLLVVLALIVGAGAVVWRAADIGNPVDRLRDLVSGEAEDYPGPGEGRVTFEVRSGDSLTTMGQNLEEQGVVASAEAFTQAAGDDPGSTGIQAGFYELKEKMAAADVVSVLVDPDNIITTAVTVPEGLRVEDVVALLVDETDFKRKQFQKYVDDPSTLGLPAYASSLEGYLFPATYPFGPDATPESMLRSMVTRWKQAAADVDLEARAKDLGYSPDEVVTVASLVQAEGRGDDMPKVARVIYNRLENEGTAGTVGLLQIDASVNYALGRKGVATLTTSDIDSVADSPYNTYTQKGLPPAPIDAPGEAALAAAVSPADGDWYYYVTVNLRTGETKFAETPEEFAEYKDEYREYCRTQSDRC